MGKKNGRRAFHSCIPGNVLCRWLEAGNVLDSYDIVCTLDGALKGMCIMPVCNRMPAGCGIPAFTLRSYFYCLSAWDVNYALEKMVQYESTMNILEGMP